eukprot:11220739-Lingulodinium_polyedra.AAC.1
MYKHPIEQVDEDNKSMNEEDEFGQYAGLFCRREVVDHIARTTTPTDARRPVAIWLKAQMNW